MIYKFLLAGETPSKKNSRINTRSGRSFPSKAFTEWHKEAVLKLKKQFSAQGGIEPLNRAVLHIGFSHSDKRRRDLDNQLSSIMDCLVDAKIIIDDNWQVLNKIIVVSLKEKQSGCIITLIDENTEKELKDVYTAGSESTNDGNATSESQSETA